MEESVRRPKTWEELKSQYGGLEKRLPECCVEYLLFVLPPEGDMMKQASALEPIQRTALDLAGRLTKDFIWHRGEFSLSVKIENGLVYLHGETDYGDSVEDEWLIVYILRELTKTYPNLWVRVLDADGEFLLIEAASVVPKWLNPEMDANRAWIHDGKLFIIPVLEEENKSRGSVRTLSLREAVDRICTKGSSSLLHSRFVEAETFYRLEKYPEQIQLTMHNSLATIPRKLAYIIHERPRAIAPAVEAFYVQDLAQLRPLQLPSEQLHFPPRDLVTVSVRFTRVLFAQLRSHRFEAPPAWKDIISKAQKRSVPEDGQDKRFASLEIGMKLSCGFEMLANKAQKSKSRLVQEVTILLQDLEDDGDDSLPTDEDIERWENVHRDDDDSWMDIDFEQLERELQGKKGRADGEGSGQGPGSGFGDTRTQADLRKMVSRFEEFLNDDDAGIDGAEVKDMDSATDAELDSDDDEEDREVSFDENEFARMMREMMGLPPEDISKNTSIQAHKASGASQDKEDEEIRQLTDQMEVELKGHGALRLEPTPTGNNAAKGKQKHQEKPGRHSEELTGTCGAEDSDDDPEVDVDYNLAKNILESFRGQSGLAGPAGNILGMLGLHLPRDEGGTESEEEEPKR